LSPNRDGFFITFTISEGERYKFGKIEVTSRFQGLDVDTLKSYLTMSEGDWYDADEVEKTVTAMADAVGTLGYAFVEVRPNIRRNKDTRTVDLTFDIQEGPRVYVERINISGNTRTLDKVIRREFRLSEGDAFSTAKVRRSQQRLKNLGFFEKVDVSARPARRRTRPTSRSRWSSRAPVRSRSAPASRRRPASSATSRSVSATCSARARTCDWGCRSAL
jgi:outer membrane protein insertion porin family